MASQNLPRPETVSRRNTRLNGSVALPGACASGAFIPAHRSDSSTFLYAFESFSAVVARTVKVRRKKVSSAALAQSECDVFGMEKILAGRASQHHSTILRSLV